MVEVIVREMSKRLFGVRLNFTIVTQVSCILQNFYATHIRNMSCFDNIIIQLLSV